MNTPLIFSFQIFADALPLAESVYAHLETLDEWLSSTADQLEQVSISPLPSTPEESIEKVKVRVCYNALSIFIRTLRDKTFTTEWNVLAK